MKHCLTFLRAFLAALTLGLGYSAQAQSPVAPITPDATAAPGPGMTAVSNTGTDAKIYNGKVFQVMTWDDNGRVLLSWDYGGGVTGSLAVPRPGNHFLSDPDVVIAQQDGTGDLYVNLVYVDALNASQSQSQTQYVAYVYNGTTFVLASGPTPLGAAAAGLQHFNPNIDANSTGYTAVVWQQRITDSTTRIDVTPSTPLIPAYTYYQAVTFDRSFLATGKIEGTFAGCTGGTNGRVVGHLSNVPFQLLEQRLNPDVAIAENGPFPTFPIVSVTYIRHFVDGTGQFRIVNNLVVDQTYYGCDQLDHQEWAVVDGDVGKPRIAAYAGTEAAYYTDAEVVYDWHSNPCAAGQGQVDYYAIRNYGKSGGTFRPTFTPVSYVISPAAPYSRQEAVQPVVSYYGHGTHQYVVTWAGAYVNERDVWASSLEDGLPVLAMGGQPAVAQAYSRVNLYDKGNQDLPSVAGRHLLDVYDAVHLFRNQPTAAMGYKFTSAQAGNPATPLRPTGTSAVPNPTPKGRMQAYPNPSDQALELRIPLQADERVQQVTVLDAMGRRIETLEVTPNTDFQHLVWQPKQPLPTGNYLIKLVTSQRSETLVVNRK